LSSDFGIVNNVAQAFQMAPNFLKLNIEDVEALRQVGKQARDLLLNTLFPEDLNAAIATFYQTLSQ
jgi:pyruvate, water dikinase